MNTQNVSVKIDNSLKKVEDFLASNDKKSAYNEVQAVLSNTKKSKIWQESLDVLIRRFVELAVYFREMNAVFKNTLKFYMTLCSSTNTHKAYDQMIAYFLSLIERKVSEVQQQAPTSVLDNVLLDEEEIWPEKVLMSALESDSSSSKTDAELVAWLKFLYEAYKTVLENLKTVNAFENRYHDTVCRAFAFCKKYNRTSDFKKLGEILRSHSMNVQKNAATVSKPETDLSVEALSVQVDTRFKQLNTAIEMGLWQDAFKTVEDIQSLIQISKQTPSEELLVTYYEQLAKVFWVSKNFLLHAFVVYKLYKIILDNTSQQQGARIQEAASNLLLATFSIPQQSPAAQSDEEMIELDILEREKTQRLTSFIGPISSLPSKQFLIDELSSIYTKAHPDVQVVYKLMQESFDPLSLYGDMNKVFENLKSSHSSLQQYIPQLKEITFGKTLEQLSQVYQVIRISELLEIFKLNEDELERMLVEVSKQRKIQISLDHQNKILMFGLAGSTTNFFERDNFQQQLTSIAKNLLQAHKMIEKMQVGGKPLSTDGKKAAGTSLQDILKREHNRMIERRDKIEKKRIWDDLEKSKREERILKFLQEQREKKSRLEQEKRDAELKKIEEQKKKLEEQKQNEEKTKLLIQTIATKLKMTAQELTTKLLDRGTSKKNKGKSLEDLASEFLADQNKVVTKVTDIVKEQREEAEKGKAQREKKLSDMAKNLDFLERARREEEVKLLQHDFEERKKQDRIHYDAFVAREKEAYEKKSATSSQEKAKFEKMFAPKRDFIQNVVLKAREAEFNKLKAEQDARRQQKKQEWEYKRQRIVEIIAQRKKEKEELEKAKKEEAEKKRKEEQDREEKLKRQTEIQRQKELEMEERDKRKREEAQPKREQPPTSAPSSSRPAGRFAALQESAPPSRPAPTNRFSNLAEDKDKEGLQPVKKGNPRTSSRW